MELADEMNETWASVLFSGRLWRSEALRDGMFPAPTRKPTSRMRFKWGECEMELDQATEQFYEKLSERLREKGFSTRIIEDGCLEVTSEKIRGKQKTHCAVGRDGEVYCHSEDLANITRNRDLNTVLEAVNDLYPQTEHSNAPEQEPMGGMTLG